VNPADRGRLRHLPRFVGRRTTQRLCRSPHSLVQASKVLVELQNLSSHSLYNDTTAAYWHKRSRAVFMATTGAGPGEKVEYLLLLS
jgi:hypothetical protein